LVHGFVWRTKSSPKTGRGLGHVNPTIFGSTVGYPSYSLASCILYYVRLIFIAQTHINHATTNTLFCFIHQVSWRAILPVRTWLNAPTASIISR